MKYSRLLTRFGIWGNWRDFDGAFLIFDNIEDGLSLWLGETFHQDLKAFEESITCHAICGHEYRQTAGVGLKNESLETASRQLN